MNTPAYRDTSEFKGQRQNGLDQYQHASGLVIITPHFDEILLVQRQEWMRYGGMWSATGGYRRILLNSGGKLEPSLDCAIHETIEELGRIPEGRVRTLPHRLIKPDECSYETFILEINMRERKMFRPSLDYNELKDWVWEPTSEIREREEIHPGLQQFFREYQF